MMMTDQGQSRAISSATDAPLTSYGVKAMETQRELVAADWRDAKKVVAQLFAMPAGESGDDESLERAYEMAVHGEPMAAIKAAIVCFVTGRAGNGWRPSSADLGKEVRRHSDPVRDRLQRERRIDAQIVENQAAVNARGRDTSNYYALEIEGKDRFSHDEALAFHRKKQLPVGAFWRAKDGRMFMPNGTRLIA